MYMIDYLHNSNFNNYPFSFRRQQLCYNMSHGLPLPSPLPLSPLLPRYTERANLEVQLFNIQTKLRAAKQKTWYPPEGKLVSDINKVGVAHSHIALNKHTVKPDCKFVSH